MRIRKNHGGPAPPLILTLAVVSGSLLHTVAALENGGPQDAANGINQDGLQPMVSRVSRPKRSLVERAVPPSVLPVDLKNIFPKPLGGTQHFNFEEHHDNNHKGAKDPEPGNDAFSFIVIDGTEGAVYNGFSEAWQVLDEHTEEFKVRKRAWNKVRQLDQEAPKDTFEPLQESYRVVCTEGMSADECKRIFTQGAENTIIKLPQGIGMGPYARVVKFEKAEGASAQIDARDLEKIQKRSEAILARRQTGGGTGTKEQPVVYNVITDYDFAAIKVDDKPGAQVQFRCDYSNLVNYWDQAVQQPPNGANSMRLREKRWWGEFIHWIEKVTTMSKQDEGKLEAAYEHDWKLFHFDKSCKKGNTEYKASLDLDAYLNMGMHAHYSYLLHGHILPYPKVENAYGYFSVEPFVKFLLTLEGKGSITTTTGDKNIIPSIAFPGLSIKGLIRIGPQLDIIGRVDAKLEVSGKVQAGFDIKFPKAQVAFPQTQEGKDHTVAPAGVGKDALKNPKVEPILNAEINAEGTVDFTATPKLSFGIDVLNGLLMKGDVILGVDNTIELGVSANAKADINTGASAEFCYWADYKYRVFIGAEISFIDNLIDWGKDFNLASPEDPIPIAPRSCVKYSTGSNAQSKRAELPAPASSNVRESIRTKNRRAELSKRQSKPNNSPGIFGGLFNCPSEKAEDEDQCSPFAPVRKRDLDALQTMELRARQTPADGNKACPRNIYPTLFYNCEHFGTFTYTADNDKAKAEGKDWEAIGICENVFNGIKKNSNIQGFDENKHSAVLTYRAGIGGGNRNDACGGGGTVSTKGCKDQNAAKWDGDKPSKKGEARWLSCDEFPFNASEEGGSGAATACVSQVQQYMQGRVNSLVSYLRYDGGTYNEWSKSGVKRTVDGKEKKVKKNGKYRIVLHNYNSKAGDTGTVQSPMMARIVGAVNTWNNPKFSFNDGVNNGVCILDPVQETTNKATLLTYKKYGGCQVIFDNPAWVDPNTGAGGSSSSTKRQAQIDESDPSTWIIKDIIMDPNDVFDEDEAIDRIGGFQDQPMNATMFRWEKQSLGNRRSGVLSQNT